MRQCSNCKHPTQMYHRVIVDDRVNTHAEYYFCNLKCLKEWVTNQNGNGMNLMIVNKGHEYQS
jgi:hypothetical protein